MIRAGAPGSRGPETPNFGGPALPPVIDVDHMLQPFAGILHDFVVSTGGTTRYRRERIPIVMSQRFGLDSFETRSPVLSTELRRQAVTGA
jgi:hypothetical protein